MKQSTKVKNRWFIAASAVGIHIAIGTIYAKSVITLPIKELVGWTKPEISIGFSIAIAFLGLSAAFLGKVVEQKGPRFAGTLAAFFYGAGIIGTGLSLQLASLPLFYLTYGILSGIGLGLGYIAPVSTLIKWFPDRRGMATGLAIMGFGFAALIFGPLMNYLFGTIGVVNTFYGLGVLYFVMMVSSASYLEVPPDGWEPESNGNVDKTKTRVIEKDLAQLTAMEAVKTPRFYYLWLMLFINITCGIAVISVASPMAQQLTNMTPSSAALMVGLMGAFNGLGRIGWASLSDSLGRPLTYTIFFTIQIPLFFILSSVTDPIIFSIIILIILSCYGGGFSSIPAFIGDVFGTKELARIHGFMLTAWASAGIVGPTLASWVSTRTGSYAGTMSIFGCLFIVAFIISIITMVSIKKSKAESLDQAVMGNELPIS